RRITPSEMEQLLDLRYFPLPRQEMTHVKYVAELAYSLKKLIGESTESSDSQGWETLDKLVTALRLFKPGAVGYNIVVTKPTNNLPSMGTSIQGGLTYKRFVGPAYSMSEGELGNFQKFWDAFDKIDFTRPAALAVAIRRLNYAYERDKLE